MESDDHCGEKENRERGKKLKGLYQNRETRKIFTKLVSFTEEDLNVVSEQLVLKHKESGIENSNWNDFEARLYLVPVEYQRN